MKARPILFSAPMVRALLREVDPKTQTRRIAKFEAIEPGYNLGFSGLRADQFGSVGSFVLSSRGAMGCWNERTRPLRCPYGKPGDLLWVRESFLTDKRNRPRWPQQQEIIFDATPEWALDHDGKLVRVGGGAASADKTKVSPEEARRSIDAHPMWFKRPGIHMPRWASRLTLRITDVRVQRLREISEDDAKAEGCDPADVYPHQHRDAYAALWDRINGPGSWGANPWCWCLTFEVIKQNVDAVLASREAA